MREETEPEAIRAALIRQIASPVRWVETVRAIAARGVRTLIECGPGKVLFGLNRRIDKDLAHCALNDNDALQTVARQLST